MECEQLEEYNGPRDLDSLKEFVVMMKAVSADTVDIGNERVPMYETSIEDDAEDDDGDSAEV